MANHEVLYETDLAKEFKKAGVEVLDFKFKPCKVGVALNKEWADRLRESKDAAILQQIVRESQKAVAAYIDEVKRSGDELNKAIESVEEGKRDPAVIKNAKRAWQDICHKGAAELNKELSTIPRSCWDRLCKRKKQYKAYKVESGFKVTMGVVSLIGTGVSIAAAIPTMGGSIAFTIVGGLKTISALGQEIHKLARDAESLQKKLAKDIPALREEYLRATGKTKKSAVAKDAAKSAANVLLTGPAFKTLKSVDDNFSAWQNKVAGIEVRWHKQSKKVYEVMDAAKELEDKLKKSPSKKAAKVLKNVRDIRKELDELLKKVEGLGERVVKAEDAAGDMEKLLKELNGKKALRYSQRAVRLFDSAQSLALAGAGAGVGFSGAEAGETVKIAKTALGLTTTVSNEIKKQAEAEAAANKILAELKG